MRWQAAAALVAVGDKDAVAALVALLAEARPWTAWRAEALLHRFARDKAPHAWLQATPASRHRCRAAWEAWWKANAARADLRRLRQPDPLPLFLVFDIREGEVIAFGRDRKECWRLTDLAGPLDAQLLPSGRILVVENHAQRITERDRTGRVVWEHKTKSLPASCRHLTNGNTFIGTREELLEVTPDQRTVWSRKVAHGLWNARRLRHGGFAIMTRPNKERQNEVLTLDAAGKELHRIPLGYPVVRDWTGLTVLPNGNYCVEYDGEPVELTPAGQILRQFPLRCRVSFDVLPGDHLLTLGWLGEEHQVPELDREGKVVRTYKIKSDPWRVLVVRGDGP